MRKTFSAYHGGSWKLRKLTHRQDCSEHWPFAGSNSEFLKLKEVLLYLPPKSPLPIRDPEKVQHLRAVNWVKLRKELFQLEQVFRRHGVTVRRLDGDWFPRAKPNLLFIRDHFFISPWGAILGRMASPVRAGEEKWAQRALADVGIPILGMIQEGGLFEGADALWLSPREILIGLGNRTNTEAFRQIRKTMAIYGVKVIAVELPKKVQHLLGLLQIVDKKLALVRTEICDKRLLRILEQRGVKIIAVPESEEVIDRQGMNVVTLAPRHLLMPQGCARLKALYQQNGLKVVNEVSFSQGLNAAGGLACATGILSRRCHPPHSRLV